MQKKIIQCLDEPSTGFEKGITLFLILLIYVSIVQLAIEVRYPELAFSNKTAFLACEYFVLGIFTIEAGIRIIFDPNRWRYFKRFSGIVDLLAIVPGLLAIFLPTLGPPAIGSASPRSSRAISNLALPGRQKPNSTGLPDS